jgi:hypothetical protein
MPKKPVIIEEPTTEPIFVCVNSDCPIGKEGQIPVIKYRDAEAEEPQNPYVDGYKPCDGLCK